MVKYHPDSRFLTDYAAGNLPVTQALCVGVHLHYCNACKTKVKELADLGATLFMQQVPAAVSPATFDTLMSRIDDLEDAGPATGEKSIPQTLRVPSAPSLPAAIQKIAKGDLDNLDWHRLGKKFRYSRLDNGRDQQETSLLNIAAGGSIPRHSHTGDEITVILKGSFSDHEDNYHRGDFIFRTSGEHHQPVASQHEDCMCLVTLESPIRLSNWFYRLLQPLFNMKTA